MTDELPPLWASVDYPVLREAAKELEVMHRPEVAAASVADQLDLPAADVDRALMRLFDAEYVYGADSSSLDGRHVLVTQVTEKGRREVGMWPSSKDGAALIEVIENAIAQTDDEDKKSRLQQLLRSARNVGEGGLGSLAGALAAKMLAG